MSTRPQLATPTIQVAGALGLAVLAALAASDTQRLQRAGQGTIGALNGDYHVAFAISAGLVAAAAAITVGLLRGERAARPAVQQVNPGSAAMRSCGHRQQSEAR